MNNLTERTLKMTTKEGFVELFWTEFYDIGNRDKTQEEIYELLEEEYIATFGKRRYSNFKSFRRRRDE